ncbi:MAG: TMEM43 family protein [Blastocatellia bacterium]|nr:TMEM43 family protein [Blastocatellia bacterium]
MATLQIKRETLPVRCEICHQTDCFDPLSNSCSRCAAVVPVTGHTLPHTRIEVTIGEPEPQRLPVTGWVQIRAVVSWVFGLFYFFNLVQEYGWIHLPIGYIPSVFLPMLWFGLRSGFEKFRPASKEPITSEIRWWEKGFLRLGGWGLVLIGLGIWAYISIVLPIVAKILGFLMFFAFWCFSIYYDLRHFFLRHPDSES